jgi:hypothetical protein
MDAKQFAWAYLVKNGCANLQSSYYGGREPVKPKEPGMLEKNYMKSWDDAYIARIKHVGVDWDQTDAPQSDMVSYFLGTFCDEDGRKEVLTGTLILKNGHKLFYEADALEVSNVFAVMADTTELQNFYAEVFGEE